MDIKSTNPKYSGTTFEVFKDGKLNLESTKTLSDIKNMSLPIEGSTTFTPRPKRTPNKVKNPSPKVTTNTKGVTNTTPKNIKYNIPQKLSLTFTAGTVDYTFPNGDGFGFDKNVHDVKVQPDGKILVAGDFDHYDYDFTTYYSPYLCRLNPDGTFDETFDITNGGSQNGFNNTIYTIHLQEDGKIVVGGDFTYFDRDIGYTSNYIARLNSDGTYDITYAIGNGFDGSVYKIEVQSDGKTVIGGIFDLFNGNGFNRIVRLNSNGSVDSSFLVSNGFNDGDNGYVNEIKQQPDGKLLVGGYFNNYNGFTTNNIARLNTNGNLDLTFNTGNGFNDEVTSIVLQSDNKIIVGGYFDYYDNNYLYGGYILRITSSGQLDTRFGYGLNDAVISLAVQSDDKILVGGFQTTFYDDIDSSINCNRLIRFHSDCTFDYSYYSEYFLTEGVYSITILDDDMILIGGEFDTDGDPSLYPINHFGRINNKVLEYPYVATFVDCGVEFFLTNYEDFTYVVGSKTPFDFNKSYSIQSLDNPSQTYCGYVIPVYPSVNVKFKSITEYNECDTALFENSKLVIATPYLGEYPDTPITFLVNKQYKVGDYFFYKNLFINGTQKIYFHGSFQITEELPYNDSNIFNQIVPYIPYETGNDAIEANGQYVVTEDCTTNEQELVLLYQPSLIYSYVAQPNGDSYCKESYFTPSFFSPYFDDILYYENLSGGTPTLNSSLKFDSCSECLTTMSNQGIKNNNFYEGGFNGDLVYAIVEQPDGKLLVGGNFNEYDGVTVNNFMRLNPDGTLDASFNSGSGFDSYVRAIALQPDGKILVGGDFDQYNGGGTVEKLIRLNSNGTLDSSFDNGGFSDIVRAIAIQNDGKIIVGGKFKKYRGIAYFRIIRLNSDGTPDNSFNYLDGFGSQVFTIKIERNRVPSEFYYTGGEVRYEETILVGGEFSEYKGQSTGAIARLDSNGNLLPSFGEGFTNYDRVFKFERLSDGKLLIVGGFSQYNNTDTPYGIVRLNADYTIDTTFKVPSTGGVSDWIVNSEVLPDGKIMLGGQFDCYTDVNGEHCNLGYIIRLNSDGTLDNTFTFKITDNYVNKILYLSDKTILAGGWFNSPSSKLVKIFIGGNYELREFADCDGNDSYLFVPTSLDLSNVGSFNGVTEIPYSPISTSGLDLVYDNSYDDDNFVIVMPTPFDVNFLGTNYTEVNVSSNPYITFGAGGSPDNCCFEIPNDIPTSVELPGVFLSFACPTDISDYDGQMYQLYSGLTDGGNTMVIKFIGSDHCDEIANLVYGFKFYRDNSDYFDLIIEENTQFYNDDPTGGVSDGVDSNWLFTFDSSPGKSYRIGSSTSSKTVKGDINTTTAVCGNIGNLVTEATSTGGIPGSMYFDGNNGTNVTVDYNINMDLDFDSWTIEWYQYFTSPNTCCMRVFDIGSFATEHVGFSIESDNVVVWLEGNSYFYPVNTPVLNTWADFAITSEDIGNPNRTLRVFQDGVQLGSDETISFDLNNFDGPTLLPLTIGSMGNGDSPFQGYITNFRWNKGTCYYTGNFTPPASPLSVDGSQLLLLASDNSNVTTDTSGTQTVNNNGVTWSEFNPFAKQYNLYNLTDTTEYADCDECKSTVKYKSILYVRDSEVLPGTIRYSMMKKSDIDNMLTLGPIATTYGPECYELLKYYL